MATKRKPLTAVDGFSKPGGAAVEPVKTASHAAEPAKTRGLKDRSVTIATYCHPDAKKQLAVLAAELSSPGALVKMNDLMVEGMNLLFKKHNLPQIARPPEE